MKHINGLSRVCVAALSIVLVHPLKANDLLVLDNGTPPAILRYNGQTGGFVGKFASLNTGGSSMTYGPDGNLYVATGSNISRYDGQSGAFLNVFVPSGSGGIQFPTLDMTFGPDGNLYVTTTSVGIRRYNGATGQFIDMFTSNGIASQPWGLAFGPDGNLYVGDGFNVDRYDGRTGAFINHFTASSRLERAEEVRFGPDGNIYAVGNSLLKFNGKTGAFISDLTSITAEHFTFGPDGNLYASGFSINRYSTSGALLGSFIPHGSGGLSSPGAIVFIPEPGTMAIAAIVATVALSRRLTRRRG